ncbi:MAG TPA: C40 family peptidase [candidate division Zixibacteria bacterium]|nr:C40 family peptidase [candidate division Zixibacteria bacterium]
MKRICILILSVVMLYLTGCTGYPRYRGGTEDTPAKNRPELTRYGEKRADRLDTLNVSSSTDDVLRFGSILQKYLGRPYSGTSSHDPGFDCSDFTLTAYMEYNRTSLPRTAEQQAETGDPVQFNRLSFGDLVFFHTEGKAVSHVGIYIGRNQFIHAASSNGVIISSLKEKYWSQRYVGARRILR